MGQGCYCKGVQAASCKRSYVIPVRIEPLLCAAVRGQTDKITFATPYLSSSKRAIERVRCTSQQRGATPSDAAPWYASVVMPVLGRSLWSSSLARFALQALCIQVLL